MRINRSPAPTTLRSPPTYTEIEQYRLSSLSSLSGAEQVLDHGRIARLACRRHRVPAAPFGPLDAQPGLCARVEVVLEAERGGRIALSRDDERGDGALPPLCRLDAAAAFELFSDLLSKRDASQREAPAQKRESSLGSRDVFDELE